MNIYTENIIFFDTEFTNLDVRVGELLSIGLVKYSGEELYLELDYKGEIHPWVQEKVLPALTGEKVSKEKACELIKNFAGKEKPYLLSYVNQFDAVYLYKLFGSPQDHPFDWIPIDFASILFAYGYSPHSMGKDRFFAELGIDKNQYNTHSALDDARLLAGTYKRFKEKIKS